MADLTADQSHPAQLTTAQRLLACSCGNLNHRSNKVTIKDIDKNRGSRIDLSAGRSVFSNPRFFLDG
jgi:hypothetical protein